MFDREYDQKGTIVKIIIVAIHLRVFCLKMSLISSKDPLVKSTYG
jgi:hypothetical protein